MHINAAMLTNRHDIWFTYFHIKFHSLISIYCNKKAAAVAAALVILIF
jgi:hypothetical protein